MNPKHYTYRVTWSPEDGEHVALCAEFPSLSWLAKTPESALRGIQTIERAISAVAKSIVYFGHDFKAEHYWLVTWMEMCAEVKLCLHCGGDKHHKFMRELVKFILICKTFV